MLDTRGYVELAHDVPYPQAGFRGGIYDLAVRTYYKFTLDQDRLTLNEQSLDPKPTKPVAQGSSQSFRADAVYSLSTRSEADLQLRILDQADALLGQSVKERVRAGSGTKTLSIPAFKVPVSAKKLYLKAVFLDASTGVQFRDSLAAVYEVGIDLSVERIEVVQVTQTIDNSVPLIAGKPAIARVFIKIGGDDPQPVAGVAAELKGPGGETLYPYNYFITAQPKPDRTRADDALNFELPKQWLAAGELKLTAVVKPPSTITEAPEDNNSRDVTVRIEESTWPRPYRIGYLSICIEGDGRLNCPQEARVSDARRIPLKLFPLTSANISYSPIMAPEAVFDLIREAGQG